jgi:SecD/SecF fusion protein
MIDTSVNQTLSRTLLTGTTTILVLLILYIWGGDSIHGFAFSLVVGVIAGTYSSVFIAAPLLLWMLGTKRSASRKPVAA